MLYCHPVLPPCTAGDIDPAIIPYLCSHGLSVKEVDTLMNKKSGFLGLAGEGYRWQCWPGGCCCCC